VRCVSCKKSDQTLRFTAHGRVPQPIIGEKQKIGTFFVRGQRVGPWDLTAAWGEMGKAKGGWCVLVRHQENSPLVVEPFVEAVPLRLVGAVLECVQDELTVGLHLRIRLRQNT
jgi:hypothetical protein